MFPSTMTIAEFDPDLAQAIAAERARQEDHVELIASENYASPRVLEAQGTVLTNKYAEGYPGKRYYGGCEFVDVAEALAIERAKQLFGCEYANVQPHSGSQANAAVYFALLNPGDTILGMSLAHGGHLTHGAKVNFSGKVFNAVQYGLDMATELIDYAEIERLAQERGFLPASLDPRIAAMGMVSLIDGLVVNFTLEKSTFPLAGYAPAVLDAYLAGLNVVPPTFRSSAT